MEVGDVRKNGHSRPIGEARTHTAIGTELESAWRERRWGAFLRAWIASVALAAVAGFVAPLVMVGVYILISLLRLDNRFAADLLSVCLWISGLAGFLILIFTMPIMALKSLQGYPARQ
jgi:hypothetical protein